MRLCVSGLDGSGTVVYSIGGSRGCLLKPLDDNVECKTAKGVVSWLG
jgi:hypothetical protein